MSGTTVGEDQVKPCPAPAPSMPPIH